MKTAIITDTNSGMLPEDAREHGIILLPMPVIIDGKAVSCALAESVTDKVAVIGSVSTLKEYRQRGFASACIRSLVSDLQTSGRDILLAFTNKSLSGFYFGLGFKPTDEFYIYHGKENVDRNH